MSDLPRPPIEPLPPPPGEFDRVLERARRRRHDRGLKVTGVVAVFLTGLAGGMSLNDRVPDVTQALVKLAGDQTASAPAPVQSTTAQSASRTPKARTPSKAPSTATVTASPPDTTIAVGPNRPRTLKARAVTESGEPVAGLFVYAGVAERARFAPEATARAVTAADGTFSMPCPGTPVLLSPWPVNAPAGELAGAARWAPTFVGGASHPGSAVAAPCSRGRVVQDVVVQAGSTLTGIADVPETCTEPASLRLRLFHSRNLRVRLDGLRDGDQFRVAGLPAGQHTVVAGDWRIALTLGGTSTQAQDVTFACGPVSSPSPTSTSEPSPSGDPTLPTDPSPTPTSPSPGATSTGSKPDLP